METAFVVLLMTTAGLSHGLQSHCDARQNGTQCFGAVGGTVDLRLLDRIETGLEYTFYTHSKQEREQVFLFKKRFMPAIKYQNRSYYNGSSGTFGMSDITRSDEAQYVLYIYDIDGTTIETKHLHLSVQAPVSRLQLSSECLSRGQRRLSCSGDGDSVQYSWTLDGEPLTDNHLFSGGRQDTQSITLTQGLSGLLACGVSNSVSRDSFAGYIKPCPGFKLINCTLSNGTHISGWVSDHDPRCTMTPITTAGPPTTPSESSSVGPFVYFQVAELCVLLATCVGFYAYFKMATRRPSAPQQQQDPLYANMVVMETQ